MKYFGGGGEVLLLHAGRTEKDKQSNAVKREDRKLLKRRLTMYQDVLRKHKILHKLTIYDCRLSYLAGILRMPPANKQSAQL